MELKELFLFIPRGYGAGTILYDLDNKPYEVCEDTKAGGNLRRVVPVEIEYAKRRVQQGTSVLISE